ncbi:MAG TPA: phenylalanine--tRNA ligase subunit beta [Polyangiaceae bacterium]|nr:phenylalanine--tRNA ligase subunit beta [Polyangiaceae bacterium]
MLISYRWLGRHIDLADLSPTQIANDLTLSTAEVESVEEFLPHARELVVGRVLTRKQHPGADRLSLCEVDIGAAAPVPVVCGAANVAAGQTIALALPGTTVPKVGTLKKSKIRGEASEGMICSEQEVGIAEQSEGIWVLPESLKLGQSLADALGLGDWVIDIDNKSLTHRPDLWGHRGIARELSAIYRRPLKPLDTSLPKLGSGAPVPVRVESEACSCYLALPIDGARPLASPLWLRTLLAAVGQRSLGQLVDLSNFVMLDLGQPNHVFDRARLGPDGISVRKATPKERFEALDGRTLELSEEDLLITSRAEAVALAGVIGGAHSEVKSDTNSLLLEVATFDATTVRRTTVRHTLRTDSSARFEKSLDPNLPAQAAGHFARLLGELQPEVSFPAPLTEVRSKGKGPITIALRPERVRTLLGAPLSDEVIADLLTRLGFGLKPTSTGFDVAVPSDRATKDIGIEQDLVEEVGRLFGYGNINEQSLLAKVVPPAHDERRAVVRKIQDRLGGAAHFTETLSYSFHSDELLALVGMDQLPHATLANPVVAPQSRLRRSVAPSLLVNLEANRRHRDLVRLFEVGKGYLPENENAEHEPQERHLVGLVWAAPPPRKGAGFQDNALSSLQGVISDLLATLERPAVKWEAAKPEAAPSWAAPGRALVARYPDGSIVAMLANVSTDVLFGLGLKGRWQSDVALAEISIDAIVSASRETRKYVPIPRFPGIKVDVAIAAQQSVLSGDVVAVIEDAAGGNFRGAELFDVYQGDALGAGMRSLAYHVLLQSEDKTLSEAEEQKFLKRLRAKLEAIGAELRDS